MIDEILNLPQAQAPFVITPQLRRIENLNLEFPDYFEGIESLSRDDVTEILSSERRTYKEKLFAILLWGIYFEVAQKGPKVNLINWVEQENSESEIKIRFDEIANSDSPKKLFEVFQKDLKIPGLGYAYYTKIFYFVRKAEGKSIYPILDKWLMCAFTAISGTLDGNTNVFKKYMKKAGQNIFDGGLRRKKPECYVEYVQLLTSIASEKNIEVDYLEEKLFGVDLRCDRSANNPRNMYRDWAIKNGLKIDK
jgi:hypothetical protein